jgi:flagellar biosynthetic protein FliR
VESIAQLTDISTVYMGAFLLVLTRVSAMIMTAPILGHRSVPAPVKIALSLILTLVLLPLSTQGLQPVAEDIFGYGLALGRELLLGVLLGFATTLVFMAFQMAASFIGLQIGVALTQSADPVGAGHLSLMDQLYSVLVGLVFLSINGHHLLIQAIDRTFQIIPLNTFAFSPAMANGLIVLTSQTLLIAVKIAFPILASLLIVDVALGIISRVVPQLNVFFVGLPLKVGLGLLTIALALPVTLSNASQVFHTTIRGALSLVGSGA